LLAIPLDGTPPRVQDLGPDATSAADHTDGRPARYLLIADDDFSPRTIPGTSDLLCSIPGITAPLPGAPTAGGSSGPDGDLGRTIERGRDCLRTVAPALTSIRRATPIPAPAAP
jgi:hypothetical protein